MPGEVSSVELSPNGVRHQPSQRVARRDNAEYKHVLVPISLLPQDRPAILLGLQTAAAHGATVTLLHVSPPPDRGNSLHWLDAIDSLHQSRPPVDHARTSNMIAAFEASRTQIMAYLDRYVPPEARSGVDLQTEYRVGEFAGEIARFASEKGVDLVVLAAELSSGWLPVVPAPVRRVLQLSQTRVALVVPNASDMRA